MGARYQEMAVRTASPLELVVRFYERAVGLCQIAAEHQVAGRIEARSAAISRALAIVAELSQALDHERGGEIAKNLASLYQFVSDQLLEASLSRKVEPLQRAERILRDLLSAWTEIQAGNAAANRGG